MSNYKDLNLSKPSVLFPTVSKVRGLYAKSQCVFKYEEWSSRFGDMSGGVVVVGESTVGEFSLSSLKLKLFLLRDSAPVRKRDKTKCRQM